MRLLIVARALPPESPAGRSAAFARLISSLRARHDIRLVAGYRKQRDSVPSDSLGVDLGGAMMGSTVALWRAAKSSLRRHKCEAVVTQGLLHLPLGIPTVAVVRDLVRTGWETPGRTLTAGRRWLGRRAHGVVAPTQAVRTELRSSGLGRWQIHVFPEVLDPAAARSIDPTAQPAILIHPGRILPNKGQHLSVDAVSRLPAAAKAMVELHIAGPAGDDRYLHQLRVAARGQPVHFHTEPSDMDRWLSSAHLALYPTAVPEGFADAAAAAMAHGIPVVWADHPGVRETVLGMGGAVAPDDAGSVRDAVLTYLAGRTSWHATAALGRNRLLAAHDPKGIARRWDALLTGVTR